MWCMPPEVLVHPLVPFPGGMLFMANIGQLLQVFRVLMAFIAEYSYLPPVCSITSGQGVIQDLAAGASKICS